MKESNLVGVWESSDETVTVYSTSNHQAVQAAHLLKESVIETPVIVKYASRRLLSQKEWRDRSAEIEKEGEGLIKIITQIDKCRILILCTDKWEGISREYVDDFMMQNTIYNETLNLDPGMMRYIQMNCAQAIDKVAKDLQRDKGNLKIINTGIMIKGTRTGLNKARFAVDQIVKNVQKEVSEKVPEQVNDIIEVKEDLEKKKQQKMISINEIKLELDPGMTKYLGTYCFEALRCIENDLASDFVNVKIEKGGIVIKGTEDGISRAKYVIELILKSIPVPLIQDESQDLLQACKKSDSDSKTVQSSINNSAEPPAFQDNCGTGLKSFQHFVECETCGSYSEFYCNNCHQRMCENCKVKHLVHPDNRKHEITLYPQRKKMFWKQNCKLHPTKIVDLCCNDCQEAICSLCTTTENHGGHHFLDLERVFTEHTTTCLKDVCRIRDDILPKSQDLLENTKRSLVAMKRQLKNIRETMQEQAKQLKNLVDEVLSKNLQVLGDLEASAINGLSTEEETLSAYVSNMQQILEELQTSISSDAPYNIAKIMKKNTGISINPIPVVANYPLPVFTEGVLCKEEITKQFGSLQMEGQGLSSPT